MSSKRSGKYAISAPTAPEAEFPSHPSIPDPSPRTGFLTAQRLQQAVKDLRNIRSNKLYLAEGAPSFRQWAINLYGERLGIWLDEVL